MQGEGEHVEIGDREFFDQPAGVFKGVVRFARESGHDIDPDGNMRDRVGKLMHKVPVERRGVGSVHGL